MVIETTKDEITAQLIEEIEYHRFFEYKLKECEEELEKLRLENSVLKDIWANLGNMLKEKQEKASDLTKTPESVV